MLKVSVFLYFRNFFEHKILIFIPNAEKISKQQPSLIRAFKRPEMLWALALIVCYRIVEAPAMAMLNPMLIDQKWSLSQIGVLMSVIGAGIGLLAAVSAAFLLKKIAIKILLKCT